jgi:hypothetical protein
VSVGAGVGAGVGGFAEGKIRMEISEGKIETSQLQMQTPTRRTRTHCWSRRRRRTIEIIFSGIAVVSKNAHEECCLLIETRNFVYQSVRDEGNTDGIEPWRLLFCK